MGYTATTTAKPVLLVTSVPPVAEGGIEGAVRSVAGQAQFALGVSPRDDNIVVRLDGDSVGNDVYGSVDDAAAAKCGVKTAGAEQAAFLQPLQARAIGRTPSASGTGRSVLAS